MAKFASLPLFTDAYLADTGHLSDAEHGRYLLLLMTMWRVPGCRLPNDDQWLARHFRRSVEEVHTELRPIISEFMQSDGNWITQKRLCKEFRFVTIAHEKRSDAAKSREYNKKTEHNAYAPSPSPSPSIKKEKSTSYSKRNLAIQWPEGWVFGEIEFAAALVIRPLWSRDKGELEFTKFHNHALAKGSSYKNWPAAWRSWCGSKYQDPQSGGSNERPSLAERARDLAKQVREQELARGIIPTLDLERRS